MKTSVGRDTKTHILDTAEQHFAIYGFAGTSLRGIIKDAGVNVAAVAYHFGSKEELYSAVIQRFAAPVVEKQLLQLRLETSKKSIKLPLILKAFYEPPISLVKSMGKRGESLSLFLGRCQSEPEPVYSLVDKHFAACRNEFLQAFRKALPGLSEAEYHWRFEFMLSLIVCFLTRQQIIRPRYSSAKEWQANNVIDMLVNFCVAGMQQ